MTAQNGLIRPHQSKLSWIYRILDMVLIYSALFLSCWLVDVRWNDAYLFATISAVALLIIVSGKDLYQSCRTHGPYQELYQLYIVWTKVVVGLLALAFVIKNTTEYSHLAIAIWFILAPILMTLSRIFIRNMLYKVRRNGWNTRNVAIFGINPHGLKFAKTIKDAAWMGFNFVGFIDDRVSTRHSDEETTTPIGGIDTMVQQAREGKIDTVYITLPLQAEQRTREIIARLADTTVSLYYVPDFESLDSMYNEWSTFGDSAVISVYENPCKGVNGWAKRLTDILLASSILSVIAIPLLIIALGVKLSSPGPIIFKQRRYGINGESIEVWKFRSMTVCENGNHVKQASKGDARITRFGAFIRRTSLDELPQFINVLSGKMSVVGPRPHAITHNEEYRGLVHRYMLRHKVKPGITGWAQINGWRGETDTLDKMVKRIEHDLEYIQKWSLWFDLKIFCMTFLKGFINKNAY